MTTPLFLNNELEIEIDVRTIVNSLKNNPEAMRELGIAVRDMQTKQVRRMGNLYGKTAQQPKTPPTTKMRLT